MSATLQELERDALALPPEQRAQLVDKLWESLGDTPYPTLSEAWREEIERRRRDLSEGRARVVPGEEVSRKAWGLVTPSES